MKEQGLPIGLARALALDEAAMKRFAAMTDGEKAQLIRKAQMIRTKSDMLQLISTVTDRTDG